MQEREHTFQEEPIGPGADDFEVGSPLFKGKHHELIQNIDGSVTAYENYSSGTYILAKNIALILLYEFEGLGLTQNIEATTIEVNQSGELEAGALQIIPSDILTHPALFEHNWNSNYCGVITQTELITDNYLHHEPLLLITVEHNPAVILTSQLATPIFSDSPGFVSPEMAEVLESENDFALLSSEDREFIDLMSVFYQQHNLQVGSTFTFSQDEKSKFSELYLRFAPTTIVRFSPLSRNLELNMFIKKVLKLYLAAGLPRLRYLGETKIPNPLNQQGVFNPTPEFYTADPLISPLYKRTVEIYESLTEGLYFLDDGTPIEQEVTRLREILKQRIPPQKDKPRDILFSNTLNPAYMLDWVLRNFYMEDKEVFTTQSDDMRDDLDDDEDVVATVTDIDEMEPSQKMQIALGEASVMIRRSLGLPAL